jgi:predicted acylesterase/phospholipase RssA
MRPDDLSIFKNKKLALVLSGGVTKASAWHLGVARALTELGFVFKHNESKKSELEISTYVGSSAGSLIGLYLASGYGPEEIINSHLNKDSSRIKPVEYSDILKLKKKSKVHKKTHYSPFSHFPFIIRNLLNPIKNISGVFSTHGLNQYIQNNILTDCMSFESLDADLFVVATQLDHSRKVIFSKYKYPSPYHDPTAVYYNDININEAVSASMSVPPFYSPTPVKNPQTNQVDYYIDGEIRETLSTHVAIDNKCDFVISSWTHTPYHYQEEVGSLVNYGLPAICTQAIYLMIQKKIVDSRARRATAQDILATVQQYLTMNKFDTTETKKLISILERKLNHNPDIQFIDIFPKHENFNIFFKNPFSLNPNSMKELIDLGYQRTLEVFSANNWNSK